MGYTYFLEFSRAEICPRASEMDDYPEKNHILEVIAQTAEFGMLAAMLPEERGGQGLDLHSFLLALTGIARESAAVAALCLNHNLACKALELAGLELPGSYLTDLYSLGLPAHLENGSTNGTVSGICDFVPGLLLTKRVVLVSPDGEVATVALDGNGVTVACEYNHGLRAARPGALELEKAEALQSGKLAGEYFDYILAVLCLGTAAIATGIASKGAEVSRAYSHERYQGGSIIHEHQQLRLMLGGMRAVEETGLTLLRGACSEDGDRPSLSTALAVKALVCERAREAASNAVQLHGGYGYMRDYGMERLLRDASYCCIWPFSSHEALLHLEKC